MHANRFYRLYFIDSHGHIAATSDATCTGDEQACSAAIKLFAGRDKTNKIEVWEGARMVFRYP